MKFLIAGAGAIGGYIGACLARAGEEVTLFARGPHLKAMQERGVRVISGAPADEINNFQVPARAIGDLSDAGQPDVIFLGVKAHGLTGLAPALAPLIGENTAVVSTQNGIPWWFFQNDPKHADLSLERVDPGGAIAQAIPAKNVVGSIAYFATDVAEPGVIRHIEGNRLSIGEPDGSRSDRCRDIAEALVRGGLRAPVTKRLKVEIFVKLMGNASFNPISALTRATLVRIAQDHDTRALVAAIMEEVVAIAEKLGMKLPISIDQRIAGAEAVGEHKTSMLQDLELGRPMELECLAGALVELGEKLDVPTPHLASIYATTKLLGAVSLEQRAR